MSARPYPQICLSDLRDVERLVRGLARMGYTFLGAPDPDDTWARWRSTISPDALARGEVHWNWIRLSDHGGFGGNTSRYAGYTVCNSVDHFLAYAQRLKGQS